MTVIRDTGISQKLVADLRDSISACTAVRLGIATHVEKERCLREKERNGKQSTQRLMKSTGKASAALYAYPSEL